MKSIYLLAHGFVLFYMAKSINPEKVHAKGLGFLVSMLFVVASLITFVMEV